MYDVLRWFPQASFPQEIEPSKRQPRQGPEQLIPRRQRPHGHKQQEVEGVRHLQPRPHVQVHILRKHARHRQQIGPRQVPALPLELLPEILGRLQLG